MKLMSSPFSISIANPNHPSPFKPLNPPATVPKFNSFKPSKVSINPPPPDFDYKSSIVADSRAAIAQIHPELLDLADNGTLVLIQKSQFGPVPAWRTEFVEPEGIWLIGTSHISRQSALDVERLVRVVKPESVVVELCRSRKGLITSLSKDAMMSTLVEPCLSAKFVDQFDQVPSADKWRAGIMYTSVDEAGPQLKSSMFSLSGNGFFGAIGRSLNLGGQTALALRLLLAVFSSKLSSDADRPFGDEFRAARKTSEEVGAQVVLGDRPIEITLERAWKSLKWNEKLRLVNSVLRGISSSPDMSRNSLKESTADDSAYQLYDQLSRSYPSLMQPLIHERDTYLSWSLKRSKAVNGSKRVVGVIGKGHLNGVIYALVSDLGDLRFRDLVGKKSYGNGSSNTWVDTLVKNLVRDTVIGVLLWGLYEQLKMGF